MQVYTNCTSLQVANFCLMRAGLMRNKLMTGRSHHCGAAVVCTSVFVFKKKFCEKGGIPVLFVTCGTFLGHSVKPGGKSGKDFPLVAF